MAIDVALLFTELYILVSNTNSIYILDNRIVAHTKNPENDVKTLSKRKSDLNECLYFIPKSNVWLNFYRKCNKFELTEDLVKLILDNLLLVEAFYKSSTANI